METLRSLSLGSGGGPASTGRPSASSPAPTAPDGRFASEVEREELENEVQPEEPHDVEDEAAAAEEPREEPDTASPLESEDEVTQTTLLELGQSTVVVEAPTVDVSLENVPEVAAGEPGVGTELPELALPTQEVAQPGTLGGQPVGPVQPAANTQAPTAQGPALPQAEAAQPDVAVEGSELEMVEAEAPELTALPEPEAVVLEEAPRPAPAGGELQRAAVAAEPLVRQALRDAAPVEAPGDTLSALERLSLRGVDFEGEPYFLLQTDDAAAFELTRGELGQLAAKLGSNSEEASGLLLQQVASEGAATPNQAASSDTAAFAVRFVDPLIDTAVAPTTSTGSTTPLATPRDVAAEAATIQRAAEVLAQIRTQLQPGLQRMSIKLMPEELGRVSIEIAIQDGRVGAVVSAESQRTLELLERQSPELKGLLAQQGFEVGEISLELDQDLGGSANDAGAFGARTGASNDQPAHASARAVDSPPEAILEILPPSRLLVDEDGVDMYA